MGVLNRKKWRGWSTGKRWEEDYRVPASIKARVGSGESGEGRVGGKKKAKLYLCFTHSDLG